MTRILPDKYKTTDILSCKSIKPWMYNLARYLCQLCGPSPGILLANPGHSQADFTDVVKWSHAGEACYTHFLHRITPNTIFPLYLPPYFDLW